MFPDTWDVNVLDDLDLSNADLEMDINYDEKRDDEENEDHQSLDSSDGELLSTLLLSYGNANTSSTLGYQRAR
jgi:hypothetical protein